MAQHQKTNHETTKPSPLKWGARLAGRVFLTLLIIGGAGLAVQIGASELTRRAEAAPTPAPSSTLPVSASPLKYEEGYTLTRTFVGQVEPQKTVSLSFELPGRLQEINVDEGDLVSQGQVLATQNTALLEADRARLLASKAAIEAQLRFAIQTVSRSEALTERGFTSEAGLDEAVSRRDELRARIAETDAALNTVEIRIEKSQISAPFDGRITQRQVDGGETLAAGQGILGLVQLKAPQVRIGLPLNVEQSQLAQVEIDIDGVSSPASLVTLRPDIDPVTRTRTAIFEVKTDRDAAFGQTARLHIIDTIPLEGVWLPTTSLKEGVRGQWTILMVDPDQKVRAAAVEILHTDGDQVYVRGAFPDGTLLIDEGPQRVTVGQKVAPQSSSKEG